MFQWLWSQVFPTTGPRGIVRFGVEQLMTAPIERPEMLDQLWGHFEATGDLEAVRRLISILDWHDLIRDRLQAWLTNVPMESWEYSPNREYRQVFDRCLFPIKYEQREIEGPLDLDIQVARSALAGKLKFAELPIPLTAPESIRLGMKSAALWSLRSQAEKFPDVALLCHEESSKAGGAARLILAFPTQNAPQS